MKVAYFYPWIFCKGGAERVILELLKRTKHEFDLFTFSYDKKGTFPEFSNYNITELAHLDVQGVLSRGARFGFNSLVKKIPNLKSYDVFNIGTAGVADLMAIRNNKIPVMCFCHTILRPVHEMYEEYKSERFKGWRKIPFVVSANIYRILERMAWSKMNLVLCNSQNTKKRVINANLIDEDKVKVLNPGVDMSKFKKGRYGKYFLATGRIQWYKRLELAIDALELMKEKGFSLKIVGGVSEKDKPVLKFLKKRAKGLDVEFVISPSDGEIIELYANCYSYLFTAKDEDWGIVPVEAMASGKPVISVDEGGPRESVVHGKTGFLVKAKADVFAERMDYLAGNPSLVKKMGEKARKHVRKYDWSNFSTEYDRHLESL
jgi:glycosyltransferase involved in cell wall biosynthesis